MFMHPARHFTAAPAAVEPAATGTPVLAGTRIETAAGWRDAASLRAGDLVHTFDGGLRPLALAEPLRLPPEPGRMALRIAGGTFGACADLTLLPGSAVLVATGARRPEAARARLPVLALRALPGAALVPLPGAALAIRLAFAAEEAIWVNTGVVLHLPGLEGGPSHFTALDAAAARDCLLRQAG